MKTLGAVLVGGQSSRFGNQNKATALLAGTPLVQHVVERLAPQVDRVVFSGSITPFLAEPTSPDPFSSPQLKELDWIADATPDSPGPLAAVLNCLSYAKETGSEWLLTSPCDTPFLPHNLREALYTQARKTKQSVCIPKEKSGLQPAHGLWHCDCLADLHDAVVENGVRGFHQFFDLYEAAVWEWPEPTTGFFNINRPEDLTLALERM